MITVHLRTQTHISNSMHEAFNLNSVRHGPLSCSRLDFTILAKLKVARGVNLLKKKLRRGGVRRAILLTLKMCHHSQSCCQQLLPFTIWCQN